MKRFDTWYCCCCRPKKKRDDFLFKDAKNKQELDPAIHGKVSIPTYSEPSPCGNLENYPNCKNYCEWHKRHFKHVSKQLVHAAMRYVHFLKHQFDCWWILHRILICIFLLDLPHLKQTCLKQPKNIQLLTYFLTMKTQKVTSRNSNPQHLWYIIAKIAFKANS